MKWIWQIGVVLLSIQLITAAKVTEKDVIPKITDEEKKFIKAVEEEFGVKDTPAKVEVEEPSDEEEKKEIIKTPPKTLPAVIAIEIINDTDSDGKTKRTIDANLGYGYKTNTGYSYTYFGKPKEESGKFMIYPYSQEDIPPPKPESYYRLSTKTKVDIQPSKAFELVPVHDHHTHQHEIPNQNEQFTSHESPPPPQPYSDIPSTLYSTYEGGHLSQLSGQFPNVMPNYLVDSNQLLHHPQFENVGITPEHLKHHSHAAEQPIVPVLVLRIPSSHLQNPSAELYPNLPSNYPLSNYLNGVNLQQLVYQYLHQLGYPAQPPPEMQYVAPEMPHYVQTYAAPLQDPQYVSNHVTGYQNQEKDARYLKTYAVHQQQDPEQLYTHHRYPSHSGHQSHPMRTHHRPQVVYGPPTAHPGHGHSQSYAAPSSSHYSHEHAHEAPDSHYIPQHSHQTASPHYSHEHTHHVASPIYSQEQTHQTAQYADYHAHQEQQEQPHVYTQQIVHYITHPIPEHGHQQAPKEYDHYNEQEVPAESFQQHYQTPEQHPQEVEYTHQSAEEPDLPISENYPSHDHTRVTIISDKQKKQLLKQSQAVAYVTPAPDNEMYHKYKVMAPMQAIGYLKQMQHYETEQQENQPHHSEQVLSYVQSQKTSPHARPSPKRSPVKMGPKGFRKTQTAKPKAVQS